MSAAAPTRGLLAGWEDAHQVLVVPMGEVYFVDFRQTPAIGTRGLGSCSVAVIASEYGAILAHIPPLPLQSSSSSSSPSSDPHAGDNNVRTMMNQVKELYDRYGNYHFFPASSTHVVCALYQGEVALPDQLAIMKEVFRQMGLESASHTYNVAGNRAIPGQGTVIVISSGHQGRLPSVYVEDELVTDQIPSGEAPAASSQESGPSIVRDYGQVDMAQESATSEYGQGDMQMTQEGYVEYGPDSAQGEASYGELVKGSASTMPGGTWREVHFKIIPHITRRDEYIFRDVKNRPVSTDRADWHRAEYKGKSVWTFKGKKTTYYTYQKIRQ